MARSINQERRTVGKLNRATTERARIRRSLVRGDFESCETFAPTRTFRTGVEVTA
jgi:hypothetical protein